MTNTNKIRIEELFEGYRKGIITLESACNTMNEIIKLEIFYANSPEIKKLLKLEEV